MTEPAAALEVAVRAARAGGEILLQGLSQDKQVSGKNSRTSIVTWADGAAQSAIARVVAEAFPDHSLLGEEGSAGAASSDSLWIVDPLDGTSNYAHGFPFYCVSIALVERGQPLAGVVYDPLREELFAAARGRGARLNGRPLIVSSTEDISRALVITGVQSDDAAVVASSMKRAERLFNTVRAVRLPGSPALSLSYVACGRAEAFCHGCINAWDVAAGRLLVEEAGGRVTNYRGTDALEVENASSILGSNGRLHQALLEVLKL